MELNWSVSQGVSPFAAKLTDNTEFFIHYATCEGTSDSDVQLAINACTDKACALLDHNIRDDSRYLLFEWDSTNSTLTIVVTDDSKQKDSPQIVQCHFPALNHKLNTANETQDSKWQCQTAEIADHVHYSIKDYLTTCAPFLRYSLIAAFHQETRATCTLL